MAGTAASSELRNNWVLARNSHFEVYSDAGAHHAKLALAQFEKLRSFFDVNRLIGAAGNSQTKAPVRIISFSSRQEYEAFKLRTGADAYYNGMPDRDYIVMPMPANNNFPVAAHEYAHLVLHSEGLNLPAWLNEGLAEVFSTVSITDKRCEFGGQLAARVQSLRRSPWLSATELIAYNPDATARNGNGRTAVFYAESWAMADMLLFSPEYAPHFGDLIHTLRSGNVSSQQAFAQVYKRSADAMVASVQSWIARNQSVKRVLPALAPDTVAIDVADVSAFDARLVLADLLVANGELQRAEQLYKDLLVQAPAEPDVLASLGTVALRKGDRQAAAHYWHLALDHGLNNATLCYRYAVLGDEINLPSGEIEHALERAIQLRPHYEDALYRLALLKSNAGNYEGAVDELRSMKIPQAGKAFAYWTALAYALAELGQREESQHAAKRAIDVSASPQERARATEIAYIAETDIAVRFARNSAGQSVLVTTRVPHGTMEFNPFVEPGDQLQVVTGRLREVQCSTGRLTGFVVESEHGLLTLAVPDPMHVQVRNGPSEFNCGPQPGRDVKVEYATSANAGAGLLRGLEFR